jgi:hypothetical protein
MQITAAFSKFKLKADDVVSAIVLLFQHYQLDNNPKYAALILNQMLSSKKLAEKVFQNLDFLNYLRNEYEEKHIAELQTKLRSDLSKIFMDKSTTMLSDDRDSCGNIKYCSLILSFYTHDVCFVVI